MGVRSNWRSSTCVCQYDSFKHQFWCLFSFIFKIAPKQQSNIGFKTLFWSISEKWQINTITPLAPVIDILYELHFANIKHCTEFVRIGDFPQAKPVGFVNWVFWPWDSWIFLMEQIKTVFKIFWSLGAVYSKSTSFIQRFQFFYALIWSYQVMILSINIALS